MEGKLHTLESRIKGRMNTIEGNMSALENMGEELKANAIGIRQNLKELTRVVGGLARNLERHSKGSQVSVNEN